jgi:hypothetical protein
MAYVGSDFQLALAYRLGETSAPSDSNTKNQRYDFLTKAYYEISKRRNWWWQEASDTSNTNTGSTTGYPEPTNCKEFIELKINNVFYDLVPYNDNRIFTNTLGVVTLPSLRRSFKFYRFGGRYYLIPTDGNDAAVHNIKFYKRASAIALDADTVMLPDEYVDALTSYAEARYWMSIFQQAKAQAPMQEFEAIMQAMNAEQTRRGFGSAGYQIHDPEQAFGQAVGSY